MTHKLAKALALAAVLTIAGPTLGHAADPIPAGSQPTLRTLGGPLWVEYTGFSAALRSEVWFFGNTNHGPSPAPPGGPPGGVFLFANKGSQNTVYGPGGGAAALGTPTGDLNVAAYGGTFAPLSEIVFGLYVKRAAPGTVEHWFYTGDFDKNPDSRIHAKLTTVAAGVVEVAFEDLCKTKAPADAPMCAGDKTTFVDWDYNDHVFRVHGATTAPEPVSMTLIGTGLAGLAAVRRRRRRQEG